eukprot:CAMPEP_0168323456 /NCGR_PEP_ID=MMETSP0213-20121227/3492_1 /TAXON_ID=151035 /ORGANISM="Euplotes harpa, Strain FSP1.4" /LENGTH=108 /DNA_ID=CAMNT_0008325531 /DNA_START=176 /DNA_END=502 /DNA_ORIENTATION=+
MKHVSKIMKTFEDKTKRETLFGLESILETVMKICIAFKGTSEHGGSLSFDYISNSIQDRRMAYLKELGYIEKQIIQTIKATIRQRKVCLLLKVTAPNEANLTLIDKDV